MIYVLGTPLYQWDTGRQVNIALPEDMTVEEVHFSHLGDTDTLTVIPRLENAVLVADIPNILLQQSDVLAVFAVMSLSNGKRTICKRTFFVENRPKPADYVYTEHGGSTYPDLAARLELLEKQFADSQYEKISITTLSLSTSTAEMGSTVNTETVTWKLNKDPVSQTLEGESVDVSVRSVTLSGLGLTSGKSFKLTATDERGETATKSATLSFLNGVYYGVLEDGTDLNSAVILGLTRKLQSGKSLTFTVNAGSDQRIIFALPTRYGTPGFNVGGFDGGFSLIDTIDFTNASGYTESYAVWQSDNIGLGNTTVKVT